MTTYKSPGKGLQTYDVLFEMDDLVAVRVTGHSGRTHSTLFRRSDFNQLVDREDTP